MVRDESMLPTLRPGDRLLVDPRAYRDRAPAVGDLVVLVDPADASRWLVKRVAGVGPGRFWITRTGLTLQGHADDVRPPPDSVDGLELPERSVYVSGDASDRARDSRMFGPVPWERLVGRVYRRYAPSDRAGDL